jgi:steroid delta-isomerase-like uncharacterized protein
VTTPDDATPATDGADEASPAAVVETAYRAVWDDGDTDAVADTYHEEYSVDFPGHPDRLSGRDALVRYVESLHGAVADLSVTVEEVIAEANPDAGSLADGAGTRVAVRWTATGIHEHDHMGASASGDRVTVTGVSFDRVREGRIAHSWLMLDAAELLR